MQVMKLVPIYIICTTSYIYIHKYNSFSFVGFIFSPQHTNFLQVDDPRQLLHAVEE